MRREPKVVISPTALYGGAPWSEEWTVEGITQLLEPMVGETRRERIRQALTARLTSVTLLMDSPHDPHNGAAMLRSCDAFGVQEVHVIPREERFFASNLVAKGTQRWVDVIEHPDPQGAITALTARGFELIATHPQGELVPEELGNLPRVCLVMGNEHDGISQELTASAGRSVRIPMVGFVESLNVSVSAALLLREATKNRPGDLSPADFARLYARGLFRSLKRAEDIVRAAQPR
jgi:tRNA (guanosine-2'-O-)-methyltransferase